MTIRDLNKPLTSDLMEKCGFVFDGYYYVSCFCPVKFNKVDGGFTPSVDANLPQLQSMVISSYSEFLRMIASAMELYLRKKLTGMNFISKESELKFISESIKDYWKFDKELQFAMAITPVGIQLVPVNEYTFSLMEGLIRKFIVYWKYADSDEVHNTEFECHPQCICKEYLTSVIFNDAGSDKSIVIGGVDIFNSDSNSYENFFGVGIPKPTSVSN